MVAYLLSLAATARIQLSSLAPAAVIARRGNWLIYYGGVMLARIGIMRALNDGKAGAGEPSGIGS